MPRYLASFILVGLTLNFLCLYHVECVSRYPCLSVNQIQDQVFLACGYGQQPSSIAAGALENSTLSNYFLINLICLLTICSDIIWTVIVIRLTIKKKQRQKDSSSCCKYFWPIWQVKLFRKRILATYDSHSIRFFCA